MTGSADGDGPLLTVKDLRITLGQPRLEAVKSIDFSLQSGEIVGLAGESGSGKSVTALALSRLIPATADPEYEGSIQLKDGPANLLTAREAVLRRIRGSRIAYIFQEPSASFNPVFTVGDHLREILKERGTPSRERPGVVTRVMEEVGLQADREHLDAFPGDFSGGMLQRAALACALMGSPDLLVADEPTTALDASTSRRVVDLLRRLNQDHRMTVLFITHDLGLLHTLASRVLVMRHGQIVEQGTTESVLKNPAHPYTRELVDCIPKLKI